MLLTKGKPHTAAIIKRGPGRIKGNAVLHLMLLPTIVLLVIYAYGPMFGLVIAFQDYHPLQGFFKSEFVGLDNFR